MWLRHWGLARDPFGGENSSYVSLPSHDEAVARLVYSIERPERFITFCADAGLGKTTVVSQAIRETRSPRRRWVQAHVPSDHGQLPGYLADGLGLPFFVGSDGDRGWRMLARAVRSATFEDSHIVFVIDDWDENTDPATIKELTALVAVGSPSGPPPSLIRVGRRAAQECAEWGDPWTLAIGLDRLTRTQAGTYLAARLAVAGCRERVFTPRALTRLHSWSEGVPRGLGQLATLALMAAAVQGLEVVPPDVVDGVASRGLVGIQPGATA